MKQPQSITSIAESPDDERRRRMTHYLIAMVIRVICIVLCLFVQGWWLILPIIGAVVLANVGRGSETAAVERPGAIVPVSRGGQGSAQ